MIVKDTMVVTNCSGVDQHQPLVRAASRIVGVRQAVQMQTMGSLVYQ